MTVEVHQTWVAHDEAITSLQRCSEPPAIFSASTDRMAKLWSDSGAHLGDLRHERQPGERWKFRINLRARYLEQLAEAREIAQNVKILENKLESHVWDAREKRGRVIRPEKPRHSSHMRTLAASLPLSSTRNHGLQARGALEGPGNRNLEEEYGRAEDSSKLSQIQLPIPPPRAQRRTPRMKPIDPKSAGRGLWIARNAKRLGARRAFAADAH